MMTSNTLKLVFLFGLTAFHVAEASDNTTKVAKPETHTKLAASNVSTPSDMLRHIDPLDEGRSSSSHRGKDPHRNLTADQEISVALQHYQEGRKPQAMVVLNKAIARFSKNAKLFDVRATIELQSGNTTEALADTEKAVQLDPKNPIYLVNRSQVYLKFHREKEAINDLNKAVELNPDLVPARFNRGSLLAYQGKNKEALKDFERCIALNPHLPAPYFNRGSIYHSLGKKELALKDMENFIKIAKQENWKKSAQDLIKAWNKEEATDKSLGDNQ